MEEFNLRALRPDEWPAVAGLICESIRTWYAAVGRPGRFPAGPTSCLLFPQVYEAMDPGCCVVAQDQASGRLAGCCFYHPRESHLSLGIMNAHPDYFGRGVAKAMLQFVCDLADREGKAMRLVSSAMNVDSFSLYSRAGFSPRAVFHTMTARVPAEGLSIQSKGLSRVREATIDDVPAMEELEWEVSKIAREKDYRYFLENTLGIWHTSVIEAAGPAGGRIDGFLVSVDHPASNMLGPGVMRSEADAAALVGAELNRYRGRSPVFLVPASGPGLVQQFYAMGARNSEIHLFQARGRAEPFNGVVMPTFMPETG